MTDRKKRMIKSLKWGRLIIGIIGLVLLSLTSYQSYRGLSLTLPYMKIASLVIGVFSILLGLENYIMKSESFVNKFMVLYGILMVFVTLLI